MERNMRVKITAALLTALCITSVVSAQNFLTKETRPIVTSGKAKLVGAVPTNAKMELNVVLPIQNRAAMLAQLKSIYTPGSANFHKYIIRTSFTRIYAFVDIGVLGVISLDGSYNNPAWVNPKAVAQAIETFRPATIGVKVRLAESVEGDKDLDILKKAIEAAEIAQVPVMVHINGPHSPVPDLLKLMRKGDIYTHCYAGRKNFIVDAAGTVLPAALEARDRGIFFDTAQGQAHFSFDVAEKCIAQGLPPNTISTDLTTPAVQRRIYDLPTMVSKMMAIGVDLDKAIAMVTINPTKMYNFDVNIGTLKPGYEADISIFDLHEGNFDYEDTEGKKRTGRQRLVNKAVVSRGELLVNEL